MYAGYAIAWASKQQTIIALSSTKAEYITLSQGLCNTSLLMYLIKEFKYYEFKVYSKEYQVHCKAFEDNSSALKLV